MIGRCSSRSLLLGAAAALLFSSCSSSIGPTRSHIVHTLANRLAVVERSIPDLGMSIPEIRRFSRTLNAKCQSSIDGSAYPRVFSVYLTDRPLSTVMSNVKLEFEAQGWTLVSDYQGAGGAYSMPTKTWTKHVLVFALSENSFTVEGTITPRLCH